MARLLLVDDDQATLEWMEPALQTRGHDVRGCTSARAALEILLDWRPDMIVADILMPEMDGLTFARLERRSHGVPIMFVSIARMQSEAVIAGAIGYVQKPATAAEVRDAVDRVLGRTAERNRILVVDDDEMTVELYRAVLEPRFTVVSAGHGLEALAIMSVRAVDLAIVDVHMPIMNGIELIQRMRVDPALASVPVIVQSSDRQALDAPVWRDLNVSQRLDKGEFTAWLMRQIHDHLAASPR